MLLAWGALYAPAAAGAQSAATARECCLTLLFPIGARAMALGNAITARPDGSGLFVNPALLADLDSDEFFIHNLTTSIEKSNTFTLLIRSEVAGTFALSYRLVDYGEQEARDPSGNPTGTIAQFQQVLIATFSTPIVAGVNAGINYMLFQDRLDCRGFCGGQEQSGTTHGVDVGIQYRPSAVRLLTLGASLVHFGFPLQVENRAQADPTPARVRLGGAYEVLHHFRPDTTAQVWISADVVDSWTDPGHPVLSVGAELAVENTIFLWAGYGGGSGLFTGLAVGIGLAYDRFDIGVAKTFASTLLDDEDPFQITFGIRF